jgi:hypothetical protein
MEGGNNYSQALRCLFLCANSMGAILWLKVPPLSDLSERTEAQLHEGDRMWEGSVDKSNVPLDKTRPMRESGHKISKPLVVNQTA